ncbi:MULTISPECIES: hypothetical protein [unclassified Bradyrhizobium]|uniref:hypothetical protein n=1 Tax=Bradyrhizobium sp. USDA 4541 TaxID=2817704 RepID=UPI0020A2CFDD|nr:hypothetical protein [Bradyrhizobium sp. USDA 4541]MCP1849423.1 hypothetical protein [Bradyrhizobium sp. USDA 4541]
MSQPFSEETIALLDRAQRAIDDAILVREQRRRHLAEAGLRSFRLELALFEANKGLWLEQHAPRCSMPF